MKCVLFLSLLLLASCQSLPKSGDESSIAKLESNFVQIDSYFRHQFIEVEGVRWHFVSGGNPKGKTVLFLHGYPESWYSWTPLISHLDPALKYIFLDMKGYGRSEDRDDNFNWLHISNQIIQLMDTLKIEKFYVVGHDWGTHIGGVLVLNHRDRIRGFVRLGGGLKFQNIEELYGRLPYLKENQDKEYLRRTLARGQSVFFYYGENYLDLLNAKDRQYLVYEYLRPHLSDSLSKYFNPTTWDFNSSINTLAKTHFSFPVLDVILLKDKLNPQQSIARIKKEFPGRNLMALQTGHFPMWEKPKLLAETLNFFINLN